MRFRCAILFALVHRAQSNADSGCTGGSIDSRLRNVFGRHGKCLVETAAIPEIEVTDHAHALCSGCPDGERDTRDRTMRGIEAPHVRAEGIHPGEALRRQENVDAEAPPLPDDLLQSVGGSEADAVGSREQNVELVEDEKDARKRLAPVAISSIAQHAKPIGMGQMEFLRNQLMAASTVVWMASPSIRES